MATNADISALTREAMIKSVGKGIFLNMALPAKLIAERRVSVEGGTVIKRPVDTVDDMTDVGQAYLINEPMTVSRKTYLQSPYFNWKFAQVDMTYTAEEKFMNAGGSDTKVADFVKWLVNKGQRRARLHLLKQIYAANSGTSDATAEFQGIADALTHDATYGHLARSTTATNVWWQGASVGQSYTDQGTALACTIENFRLMYGAILLNGGDRSKLLAITGQTNYFNLRRQAEMQMKSVEPGPLAKYGAGYDSMMIDGIEIVSEPYLENARFNSSYATTKKYFYILNLSDWELRLHPERAFSMTEFFWQGNINNGQDEYLARIMLMGNLVCWRPAGSILRTNVS